MRPADPLANGRRFIAGLFREHGRRLLLLFLCLLAPLWLFVELADEVHELEDFYFDDALLAFAQDFPDFVAAQGAGAVQHAGDAAALAQLIGCPPDVLQATLNAVQPGTDAVTGRTFKRALQAPCHAIKVTGALFHTQGGLDIDAQARVLLEDGTPLPNVLAAGGAARGVSGQAVWGYLSGNGLLSAIAGGHIAAHTAQQLLKDTP